MANSLQPGELPPVEDLLPVDLLPHDGEDDSLNPVGDLPSAITHINPEVKESLWSRFMSWVRGNQSTIER